MNNECVRVCNQTECDAVLAVCRKRGMDWDSNYTFDDDPIASYGRNAAINVSRPSKALSYGSVDYYIRCGYQIISANQFMEMVDVMPIPTNEIVTDSSKPEVQVVSKDCTIRPYGVSDIKSSIEKYFLPFCSNNVILQVNSGAHGPYLYTLPSDTHYTVIYSAGCTSSCTSKVIRIKGKAIAKLIYLPTSNKSIMFIDQVSGEILAEIIGNNIYLMFQGLVVDGTKEFVGLTNEIMQFAASFIGGPAYNTKIPTQSTEDISIEVSRLLKQKAEHNIIRYTEICDTKDRQIKTLKDSLTLAFKEYKNALDIVESAKKAKNIESEEILRKVDKIRLYKHVDGLNIFGNTLDIYTDNIVVHTNQAGTRDIGKFKISVDLISGEIYFFNLTRRINGYDRLMNAPHVYASGMACLGNVAESLIKAIAEFEIEAIVNICIAYLTSVNTDDPAGAKIGCWPQVP